MKNVSRALVFITALIALVGNVRSQTPNPLEFLPHAVGDVWQYRTPFGEIVGTKYVDSIKVDSLSRDTFIYYGNRPSGGGTPDRYRLDTAANVYNMNFQPNYVRYKLYADSGQSWQAGWQNSDTVRVRVVDIYTDRILGSPPTTVKVYRFEIVRPPPGEPFWLGDEHLARGFGLVYTHIEPTLVYYLAGAIIDSVYWGSIVDVREGKTQPPQEFLLHQNFPNPFNPITRIGFSLPKKAFVRLRVFDLLGREVAKLVDEEREKGAYTEIFQPKGLASGVYFYRLEADGRLMTKKMILQK